MKMKILIAAGAAVLLSGCSLFNGDSSKMAANSEADMSSYFAQRLAAGRAHLDSGRPTQAITAFRQASYDPAFAAEAYNGMAVAYARIGRFDVARNLFEEAARRAPEDERYAHNLARLETRMAMLASARPQAPAQGVAAAAEEATEEANQPARRMRGNVMAQGTADSGMVRVSKHEVRLVSAEPEAPAAEAVAVAAAPAPAKPVIQVTSRTRTTYPVRVQIAARRSSGSTYPVRVAFGTTK